MLMKRGRLKMSLQEKVDNYKSNNPNEMIEAMKDLEAQIRTLKKEPMLLDLSVSREMDEIEQRAEQILKKISAIQNKVKTENETYIEHMQSTTSELKNLTEKALEIINQQTEKNQETLETKLNSMAQSFQSSTNTMDQNFNLVLDNVERQNRMNNIRNHAINIFGSGILFVILTLILNFLGVFG